MFKKQTLNIAFVGHIDHGKSTLIGRLLLDTRSLPHDKISDIKKIAKDLGTDSALAYITDQLKEEREGNLTIDTTQVLLKTPGRNYHLIDTPGHLEFIKSMLSGTSYADCAILVVDAAEGVQEQTRRHAYLLHMLGIKKMIVAVNKMDLVNYNHDQFLAIEKTLMTFLKNLGVCVLQTIPVSAKEGANIKKKSPAMYWYKSVPLLKAIHSIPAKESYATRPLRFPIQDIYRIGREDIIVGKILSGSVKQNEEVMLLPSGKKSRVASVRMWGEQRKKASCGENIGLTLDPNMDCARGQVICSPAKTPHLKSIITANVFWMAEEKLNINSAVLLRCATQDIQANVREIKQRIDSSSLDITEENAKSLCANEAAAVTFHLSRSAVIEDFDFIEGLGSFVIEGSSEILGIGIVTKNKTGALS